MRWAIRNPGARLASNYPFVTEELSIARPHILFVQAQNVPWQCGLPSGDRPEVESRVLSIDEAGTDATLLGRLGQFGQPILAPPMHR